MDSEPDANGNPHSGAAPASVDRYDRFLLSYARFATTVLDEIAAAVAADAATPMLRCARAYLLLAAGKRELLTAARAELTWLDHNELLTGWERSHRDALRAWLAGNTLAARAHWDQILSACPRDFLALKMTQFGHFYAGAQAAMRDAANTAIGHWPTDAPLHGYVLGMRAFGLEECGEYAVAEQVGRAAVTRNPDDVWARHAVAHCMEMRDRPQQGIAWLDDGLHVVSDSALHNHLRWHRALMQIAVGDASAALADYDRGVYGRSVEYLDICNDVALLARLELAGLDVGNRWQDLVPRVVARRDDQLMVFCDAHYVLAAAAAADETTLANLLAALGRHSADGSSDGLVVREVGLTLCQALAAGRAGHPLRAAELMCQVRGDLHRIGGSNAQRDLFEQLLIDAQMRARQKPAALQLLRERLRARPDNAAARAALAQLLA